ncbi:MAG TPA: tetratricopeptide repeat protein [Planctomycetota bacterium]|nr:tetratricopeptide repeat protein [Planctomycetota bacterium]
MEIAAPDLQRVRDLYDRGLYLQAWKAAEALGPLRAWRGTPARVLAGRLAGNLGASRLGRVLHFRAWRDDRENPEALYSYGYALLDRRGPLDAWNALRPWGDFAGAPDALRSDLYALRAEIAAILRDFDTAEHWLARAEKLTADRAWTCVARARILEHEDRYVDAVEVLRKALELRPWYRPAVQAMGHLLQLLDRDPEALTFLREASRNLESGAVIVQLAALEVELGHHAEARLTCDRIEAHHPLIEDDLRTWLAARRCDTAYACGDLEAARTWALQIKTPFYRRFAERLAEGSVDGHRVLLPVGFVRQHHMTCAPATLSAISRYWDMSAEHLAVAEEICYDGTPAHSERRWAEQNGWTAREFTVTWESARALIDRGIPFTLTTVEPASAHLQALIGYDGRRSSYIVRDPYQRNYGEFLNPEMLERYRSTGPRGMMLVPRSKESSLEGLLLPEAALYDFLYALQQALERHDRTEALKAHDVLAEKAPGHRLTLHARRTLASYDADRVTQLACVEELLKLFPEDANLLLEKLSHLREMGRREERLELLRRQCAKDDSPPLFWQQYARELAYDAREHAPAMQLLRRAIRAMGRDAESYHSLAGILWNRRRLEESMELYRFAACVEDRNERYAQSYFVAARHLRQTAASLLFLRNRFRRFGKKSGWPARTLFWAYEQLDRTREAMEVLEEALHLRPDDGDLLLFASDVYDRYGPPDKAAAALKAAQGRSHRTAWLRAAAHQAGSQGQSKKALELWREVVGAEPLAMDAHSALTQLCAETEGRAAALQHLREAVGRFPHHAGLHQLWIEWLREGEPADYEAAIRGLIGINPEDAWARRELALRLTATRRVPEALEQAELACRLEPSPGSHYIRSRVLGAAGRMADAKEACREAIRLSVDTDAAIYDLIGTCESMAERREALEFVRRELIRQVIFGDGLLTFRQVARDTIEPTELLALLQEALDARPDLWHAWSALVRHLAEMGRAEQALERATQATERFPLVPRLWVDLAHVHQLRGDAPGERAALEQAVRINPGWGTAARELAAAHERAGDFAAAKAVMEQAIQRAPLDPYNHGGLAQMLWKMGEKPAALERLSHSVRLEPGYEWAWGRLSDWGRELGQRDVPEKLARDLTQRRGGEARSWMVLAQTLEGPDRLEERLRALETASQLNPRMTDASDLRATLLAGAGRFKEALEVCGGDDAPLILRGRAAWIEAKRGNRPAAIARMARTVEADPSYYWGWMQLADWYAEEGAKVEYLDAAKHLVRLSPENEVALGYLGDAKLRNGDRAGSKAEFRRAIDLEPDYSFGVLTLFDLHLEDAEFDAAAAVLALAKKHIGGPYVLAREVQLAGRRRRLPEAIAALRALCEAPTDDRWPLDAALQGLAKVGATSDALEALLAAAASTKSNPRTGGVWARATAESLGWRELHWGLARLSSHPAAWAEAASEAVRWLAASRRWFRLRLFVRKERERLRAAASTWGAVGNALESLGRYASCVEWMSDWETREGVKPWMLSALVVSHRARGSRAEAARVGRGALAMAPDHSYALHRLWVAFEETLRGDGEAARTAAADLSADGLNSYYKCLRELLTAAADAGTPAAQDHLRAAVKEMPTFHSDAALLNAYRLALKHIARAEGGLHGFWTWLRFGR